MTPNRLNLRLRHWLAILLSLALLAGCQAPVPITPTPTSPEPRPTATPEPRSEFYCEPASIDLEPANGAAGLFYLLNQVIIIGPADGVEKTIDELGGADAGYKSLQTCYLRHLLPEQPKVEKWSEASGRRSPLQAVQFSQRARAELTMSLYATPDNLGTGETVRRINEVGRRHEVYADPNYLTGPREDANPISPCAVKQDPFEVGGSPFEVGGSPFEVGGSPFEVGGSSGGLGGQAEAGIFWKQWAFEQIGLGSDRSGSGNLAGEGVTVAVFDTSPYSPDQTTVSISDANMNLDLTLAFPPLSNALEPIERPDASGVMTMPVKVADHGLFAAGLVHAVAPQSQIHLVRVLNDYGCGDLWTLEKAIHGFVAEHSQDGRLDNYVLNFSLGVQQPRSVGMLDLPAEIVSLNEALFDAYGRGAVIVAASGNDSYNRTDALPMQLPADWEYVIGVAASNRQAQDACYSNLGDVLASGADGGPLLDHDCRPIAHTCAEDIPDCDFGLVSLATTTESRYRFWVGTSFAAPLVSGQAALLLGKGVPAPDVPSCIQGTMVVPSGTMGRPVVNIAKSVDSCEP